MRSRKASGKKSPDGCFSSLYPNLMPATCHSALSPFHFLLFLDGLDTGGDLFFTVAPAVSVIIFCIGYQSILSVITGANFPAWADCSYNKRKLLGRKGFPTSISKPRAEGHGPPVETSESRKYPETLTHTLTHNSSSAPIGPRLWTGGTSSP